MEDIVLVIFLENRVDFWRHFSSDEFIRNTVQRKNILSFIFTNHDGRLLHNENSIRIRESTKKTPVEPRARNRPQNETHTYLSTREVLFARLKPIPTLDEYETNANRTEE